MPLWGLSNNQTGNNKPKYANTSSVYGVSATETSNTLGDGKKIAHAGWNQQTIGTGPIGTITINTPGQGINANGFLTLTGGGGANYNVAFFIANSQNTLQNYSSNSYLNVVNRVVIVAQGDSFSSVPTANLSQGPYTTLPTFTITLGGRGGRRSYETLVAAGSVSGNNLVNDAYFPG